MTPRAPAPGCRDCRRSTDGVCDRCAISQLAAAGGRDATTIAVAALVLAIIAIAAAVLA